MSEVTYGKIVRESDWDEDAGVEGYVYIRATTTLHIPVGSVVITQQIHSPGLFRIDNDSTTEYLNEVYEEERETLLAMLAALGAESRENS